MPSPLLVAHRGPGPSVSFWNRPIRAPSNSIARRRPLAAEGLRVVRLQAFRRAVAPKARPDPRQGGRRAPYRFRYLGDGAASLASRPGCRRPDGRSCSSWAATLRSAASGPARLGGYIPYDSLATFSSSMTKPRISSRACWRFSVSSLSASLASSPSLAKRSDRACSPVAD